jgi:hypothetical protein
MLMALYFNHLVDVLDHVVQVTNKPRTERKLELMMSPLNPRCDTRTEVRKVLTDELSPFVKVLKLVVLKVLQELRKMGMVSLDGIPERPELVLSLGCNKSIPSTYKVEPLGVDNLLLCIGLTLLCKVKDCHCLCLNVLIDVPDTPTLWYIGKDSSERSLQLLVVISDEAFDNNL